MALTSPDPLSASRRAFPSAQELLTGSVRDRLANVRVVGWHDTGFDPEDGCVGFVRADLPNLVGETFRVTFADRSVYVYVLGIRNLSVDLSLARRPMLHLAGLWRTSIRCDVETTE